MELDKLTGNSRTTFTRAHILTGRALLLGEESIESDELAVVEQHIRECERCRRNARARLRNPFLKELQEQLHPTVDEIVAYATPEVTLDVEPLDESQREYIREHLFICATCNEMYTRIDPMRTNWAADTSLEILEEYRKRVRMQEQMPVLEQLKSQLLSLVDFPRLTPELTAVLGEATRETDVREVFFGDMFGVTKEELERKLPWCGRSIEITRTFTEATNEAPSEPVYSAYASEPTKELDSQAEVGNSLEITLKGANERRCTARLSAKQRAVIFEGDLLPDDLEVIKMELVVRKD